MSCTNFRFDSNPTSIVDWEIVRLWMKPNCRWNMRRLPKTPNRREPMYADSQNKEF